MVLLKGGQKSRCNFANPIERYSNLFIFRHRTEFCMVLLFTLDGDFEESVEIFPSETNIACLVKDWLPVPLSCSMTKLFTLLSVFKLSNFNSACLLRMTSPPADTQWIWFVLLFWIQMFSCMKINKSWNQDGYKRLILVFLNEIF